MSVNLMSAIFETEFFDLPLPPEKGEGRMAKASNVKLVMLALADQANDDGEGAYPGYSRLEIKTGLSRQGLSDILSAIRYNGLASVAEYHSRLGTNNYSIFVGAFPGRQKNPQRLLVKPLDSAAVLVESSHLTSKVKPLDSVESSHLTESIHTSNDIHGASAVFENQPAKPLPLDWQVLQGAEKLTLPSPEQEWGAKVDIACMNICRYGADLESLARAFMDGRRILPSKREYKGWALAFREMAQAGVSAPDVTLAIGKLTDAELTVADPWGIKKTAVALANKSHLSAEQIEFNAAWEAAN